MPIETAPLYLQYLRPSSRIYTTKYLQEDFSKQIILHYKNRSLIDFKTNQY